jgi:hypothetical protein
MELYAHHTYLVSFEVYICKAFSSFPFAKAKLEKFMPHFMQCECETRNFMLPMKSCESKTITKQSPHNNTDIKLVGNKPKTTRCEFYL